MQTEKKNEGSESLYSHKKGKVAKTKQQVMIGPWQSVNIDGKRAVRVDAFTSFYFETFTFVEESLENVVFRDLLKCQNPVASRK